MNRLSVLDNTSMKILIYNIVQFTQHGLTGCSYLFVFSLGKLELLLKEVSTYKIKKSKSKMLYLFLQDIESTSVTVG